MREERDKFAREYEYSILAFTEIPPPNEMTGAPNAEAALKLAMKILKRWQEEGRKGKER